MQPEKQKPLGRITRYGYRNDETPDSLTEAGWGAWGNRLRIGSLAVSRDVESLFKQAGVKPRGAVELILSNGQTLTLTWDDRTARSYKGKPLTGRFDIYCPNDEREALDGVSVIGFKS